MNTKRILSVAVVLATLSGAAAMAAETAAPAAAPAAAATTPQKGQKHEMNFEERKAKALEHLEKHAAMVQQKQACVQAATTADALKACFPDRGKWRGHGHDGKGWKHKGDGKADGAAAPSPAATAPEKN